MKLPGKAHIRRLSPWAGVDVAAPSVESEAAGADGVLDTVRRLQGLLARPESLVAFSVLAITGLLFLLGALGVQVLADLPVHGWHDALDLWKRWDTTNYLFLAQHGYVSTGNERVFIVFLPMYPFVVRVLAWLIHDYYISALLVSLLASVFASVCLYRLVEIDHGREVGLRAVWFLLIFPTSYFLHVAYTESFFLALVVAAFLCARKDDWLTASWLGVLATLTRINGLILLPALAVEAAWQYRVTRRFQRSWLWLAIIPAGLIVYLWLNQRLFGDPFYFLAVQREHWSKAFAWPWVGLRNAAGWPTWANPAAAQMLGWQELIFAGIGLAGGIAALLYLRPAYAVWMLLNWFVITGNTFVVGTPRYLLALFPLFVLFALLARYRIAYVSLTVWSLLFLSLFAALFAEGHWAF